MCLSLILYCVLQAYLANTEARTQAFRMLTKSDAGAARLIEQRMRKLVHMQVRNTQDHVLHLALDVHEAYELPCPAMHHRNISLLGVIVCHDSNQHNILSMH